MKKWLCKLPVLPLFAAGFLVGIFICMRGNGWDHLLSPEKLRGIRDSVTDGRAYLFYTGRIRFGVVFFLFLAGTTWLEPFVCAFFCGYAGICMGSFVSASIKGYGIRGILLPLAGCFPHFLIYIPAYYLLVRWCGQLYGGIYLRENMQKGKITVEFIMILAAVGAGVWLECCVGQGIFQKMLRIF